MLGCSDEQNIWQESSPLETPDLARPVSGRVSWRAQADIEEIPNKKSNRKLSGTIGLIIYEIDEGALKF